MSDKDEKSKDVFRESVRKHVVSNTSDTQSDVPPPFTSGDGETVDTGSSQQQQSDNSNDKK